MSYANLLRPTGQLLEALRIESFSISLDNFGVIVRDKTRNRSQLTPREKAFLSQLQLAHADAGDLQSAKRLAEGILEWRLSETDLERIEQYGREQRRSADQTPDSYSTSQILRVIGSIVDHKRGQLESVTKDDQQLTVVYLSTSRETISDEYSMPVLYNFWVGMYKKRTGGKLPLD